MLFSLKNFFILFVPNYNFDFLKLFFFLDNFFFENNLNIFFFKLDFFKNLIKNYYYLNKLQPFIKTLKFLMYDYYYYFYNFFLFIFLIIIYKFNKIKKSVNINKIIF